MKKILYPFSIQYDNKQCFLATMDFANRENAEVVCFTSVPEESQLDDAYHQALQMNGYYQTEINNWKKLAIKISRNFVVGPIEETFETCLQSTIFDYIISQDSNQKLNTSFIKNYTKTISDRPNIISFNN